MHFKYFKYTELATSLLHLIGQIIYNIYCKLDPMTINDIIDVKHRCESNGICVLFVG